jgi:hypothetical protein
MRREGDQTRSYYKCPDCEEPVGPVQLEAQQEDSTPPGEEPAAP